MLPFPNIEDIAEVKKPDAISATPWGWWLAAVLLGIIALGVLVWLGRRMWRRALVPAAPARPEKLALRELKALRRVAAAMPAAEFGGALAGIIRSFLHRRMGLLAHYSTTPEILGHTGSRTALPPSPLTGVFSEVLETCDAMKFGAGAAPDRAALIEQTEAGVESIRRTLAERTAAAPAPAPAPAPATTTTEHGLAS